jgi:hypothetical protein
MYEYLTSVTLAELVNKQIAKAGGVAVLKDQRRIGPRPRAKAMAVIA